MMPDFDLSTRPKQRISKRKPSKKQKAVSNILKRPLMERKTGLKPATLSLEG